MTHMYDDTKKLSAPIIGLFERVQCRAAYPPAGAELLPRKAASPRRLDGPAGFASDRAIGESSGGVLRVCSRLVLRHVRHDVHGLGGFSFGKTVCLCDDSAGDQAVAMVAQGVAHEAQFAVGLALAIQKAVGVAARALGVVEWSAPDGRRR